jgi:hypothetical protein
MSKKKKMKMIQKYCDHASINLKKAADSHDSQLMWFVLHDVLTTIKSWESAAEELAVME